MTNENKNHDKHLQQKKSNEENKDKKTLEQLRRWFETQGDCT